MDYAGNSQCSTFLKGVTNRFSSLARCELNTAHLDAANCTRYCKHCTSEAENGYCLRDTAQSQCTLREKRNISNACNFTFYDKIINTADNELARDDWVLWNTANEIRHIFAIYKFNVKNNTEYLMNSTVRWLTHQLITHKCAFCTIHNSISLDKLLPTLFCIMIMVSSVTPFSNFCVLTTILLHVPIQNAVRVANWLAHGLPSGYYHASNDSNTCAKIRWKRITWIRGKCNNCCQNP